MSTQDIKLLRGLISIIKQYNDAFTQEDISLLKGINKIINSVSVNNWARGQFDESKVNRDEQGRFAEQNGGTGERAPLTLEGVEEYPRDTDPLNSREIISIYIAAQGEDNKAISKEMSYSHHTIKSNISSVLRKLNAKNRTDAVVQAIRYGILDPYQIEVKIDENKRKQNEKISASRSLSNSEKKTLIYAAAGYDYNEIGYKHKLSPNTIKAHKQGFLDKLEVSDTTAAVVLALQHKLITLDDIKKAREDF